MALEANEVSSAVSGAISKIAADYAVTSANQDISEDAGTVNYGFATTDGITVSTDRSTNKIVAWQNSSVVRVTSTEASVTYKFTLMQNNIATRELYFGAKEVNGKIEWKPNAMARGRFVLDYVDNEYGGGDEVLFGRHLINRGVVTDIGDLVYQGGEPVGYEITVTAFPDANGVCAEVFHGVESLLGS